VTPRLRGVAGRTARGGSPRSVRAAFLVAAMALVTIATTGIADGGERDRGQPTCTIENATLRIDPGWFDLDLSQRGSRLVIAYGGDRVLRRCEGGRPRTDRVDRIRMLSAAFDLFLFGGPLGPGATAEADGTSEIEITIAAGDGGDMQVHTGGGADAVAAASTATGRSVFDLNPLAGGGDAELTLPAPAGSPTEASVVFWLGRGSDVADADGGELGEPLRTSLYVAGGHGPDELRGGPGDDAFLAGKGADTAVGDRGEDVFLLRDHHRDTARCGPGRDEADSDRRDDVRGCGRFRLE
jgi:hypothetical protein